MAMGATPVAWFRYERLMKSLSRSPFHLSTPASPQMGFCETMPQFPVKPSESRQ
jgi:hypothetical protein